MRSNNSIRLFNANQWLKRTEKLAREIPWRAVVISFTERELCFPANIGSAAFNPLEIYEPQIFNEHVKAHQIVLSLHFFAASLILAS